MEKHFMAQIWHAVENMDYLKYNIGDRLIALGIA